VRPRGAAPEKFDEEIPVNWEPSADFDALGNYAITINKA